MPKGIPKNGRKPRIWIDAQGNQRESIGRPSREEMEARNRKGNAHVRSVPQETTTGEAETVSRPVKPPVVEEKKVDVYALLNHMKASVAHLTSASIISGHPQESEMLKNFATIIRRDMMPKYMEMIKQKELA